MSVAASELKVPLPPCSPASEKCTPHPDAAAGDSCGAFAQAAGSRTHVRSVASMTTVCSADSMASMHAEEHPPRGLGGMRSCASGLFSQGGIAEEAELTADDVESAVGSTPATLTSRDDGRSSSELEVEADAGWAVAQCYVDLGGGKISITSTGKASARSSGDLADAKSLGCGGEKGVAEPLLPPAAAADSVYDLTTHDGAAAAAAVSEGPKQEVVAGMLYYAASSLFFAGMGVCSKMLQNEGFPIWELLFFRALVILTVSMSAILSTGGNPFGVRKGLLLLRGTLGYTNVALFFAACYYLPLATATTFTFLAPLIVALLSPWALRESPSPAVAVVIPLCLVGVVLVTQPPELFGGGVQALSAAGLAVGLLQPFFGATVKMVIRELRKTEATQVIILYLVICTLAYSTIGCVLSWQHLVKPRSAQHVALLVGLGVCGYGNQLCTTKGLAKAKAASVMSMQYFSLVFSQLAGVLVFGEFTTLPQAAGMALIVASMLGYLWHESRASK